MKKYYMLILLLFAGLINGFSQTGLNSENPDSIPEITVNEITVTASKIPLQLKLNPSAVSVVQSYTMKGISRSIAADEALKFVPGVRIDNQANGARLHMSIRGQGILSERGLRGIRVMIDGIPVNDPTGFAPDLYDIDWATVDKIEILRGSAASLYGGSSSAGVLNITTENGGDKPFGGKVFSTFGSNGFYKILGQANGSSNKLDYRVSYSHMKGDGYRDHTGFWGNNFSEKLQWKPTEKLTLQQVTTLTDYFNQNAEGLSIDQVKENPKQANPDAIPFNEYQKTNRYTSGLVGKYVFSKASDLDFSAFMRWSKYKETSNKAAQYRNFTTPGGMIQYTVHLGNETIKNHITIGTDFQWQTINEVKFKSLSNPTRVDDLDENNMEDSVLLANQTINQRGVGIYLTDNLVINNKFELTASLRYDDIYNELNDKLNVNYNFSGSKSYNNLTMKIGGAWSVFNALSLYANVGQGFIPPATEELASNPYDFSGLNPNLKPATSVGEELGIRGSLNHSVYYDVCGFYLTTDNDFFRFKLYPARGNQEVFYGNVGGSKRYGIESYINYHPIQQVSLQAAYTYSHFRYSSPDSLNDIRLPNSPNHQLSMDGEYRFLNHFSVGLTYEMQTDWTIYTDVIHKDVIQDGFNLLHARVAYETKLSGYGVELSLYVKNLTDQKYIAFTEPDPDGNCYQPGSGREFFGKVCFRF